MKKHVFNFVGRVWRANLAWSHFALAAATFIGVNMMVTVPSQAAWPERPIKIVLPFGAGGVADVTARIVADKLSEKFGQRVVIENMPGPGGINAARAVTTAPADGYTMGLLSNGTAISVAAFKQLPFDPVTQFEMVSTIGYFDLVFVVNAESEHKTLGDFIKAAKASPGKINIGTVAVGSTQNLGAELFKSQAGIDIQIIPYKNSPDIVVALLRNDVQMMLDFPPAVQGQVGGGKGADGKGGDGKLRILASSAPRRMSPDIPTADESGVKNYDVTSWNGIFAPKGTPKEVIDIMNKAIREVLTEPDLKEKFVKAGVLAQASTPEELMSRLQADIKKWNGVIDKAGIPRK